MATDVTMPRLSDSMEEGTILKWLVSEGDEVEKGQEIVEIETDKANMTYESDTAGTVVELVASEGDTLDLGEVIARIGDASEAKSGGGDSDSADDEEDEEPKAEEEDDSGEEEDSGDEEDEEPKAEEEDDSGEDGNGGAPEKEKESGKKQQPQASGNGASADGDGRVKASPVAKRMAKELGVELGDVEGSGPGGRIVKSDVEAAAEGGGTKTKEKDEETDEQPDEKGEAESSEDGGGPEREPEPEPAGDAGPKGEMKTIDLTRLQKTVSRRMAESKATAPDFQLNATIDMSACVELRARLKEVAETAPSYNDMVVKACANALREYPRVNGAYRDGHFELYSRVNIGVAVAAQDTLVVPTVFDADKKSLGEISRTARQAIAKVRDGKITPPELSGGTFTVSNLGMYGIDSFSAVINPPQAAILAVGSLKKRAVVDEESGRIVARDTMAVTMVCDHRILYGADGAEFLARVRELLESPLALAL
jgi:pyruvate dehydrogenase E2 component (dihydrolipoamide acetyltransferase)